MIILYINSVNYLNTWIFFSAFHTHFFTVSARSWDFRMCTPYYCLKKGVQLPRVGCTCYVQERSGTSPEAQDLHFTKYKLLAQSPFSLLHRKEENVKNRILSPENWNYSTDVLTKYGVQGSIN